MSKKALYFGLSVALLASTVVGVFAPNALAAGTLICTPSGQTVTSGQLVTFSATYFGTGTFPTGPFVWAAAGGSPTLGTGPTFSTQFFTTNASETYVIFVTDGYQNSSCTVTVYGSSVTPTPTPYPSTLTVSQSVRNVTQSGTEGASTTVANSNWLEFVMRITTGSQSVSNIRIQDLLPSQVSYLVGTTRIDGGAAVDGIATGGLTIGTRSANQLVTVRFNAIVQNVGSTTPATWTNTATVWGDNASAQTTNTTVYFNGGSVTPTPTPSPSNGLVSMSLRAQNVSRGQTGEYTTVGVRGGDTVNFFVRVTPQYSSVTNMIVTDYLPAGFTYINGSTTLNGVVVGDGITSAGLNIGSVGLNQTATVRFSARLDTTAAPTWGVVTVQNTAQARADGTGTVSAQVRLNLSNSLFATVSGVQTGPADSLFLALAIATLVTAMYAGYARTDRFNRRMAMQEVARLTGKHLNFSR